MPTGYNQLSGSKHLERANVEALWSTIVFCGLDSSPTSICFLLAWAGIHLHFQHNFFCRIRGRSPKKLKHYCSLGVSKLSPSKFLSTYYSYTSLHSLPKNPPSKSFQTTKMFGSVQIFIFLKKGSGVGPQR